jgi:hypothetical protein
VWRLALFLGEGKYESLLNELAYWTVATAAPKISGFIRLTPISKSAAARKWQYARRTKRLIPRVF